MTAWAFWAWLGGISQFSIIKTLFCAKDSLTSELFLRSFLSSVPKVGSFSWCIVWEKIGFASPGGFVWELARDGCLWGYLGLSGAIVLSAREDRTLPFLRTLRTVFSRLVVAPSRLVYFRVTRGALVPPS